jgi:hypothetical protein
MAEFFSIIGAETGVGSVVAEVPSVLDELRKPLESEVELLIGVKYWLVLVPSGGVFSASR